MLRLSKYEGGWGRYWGVCAIVFHLAMSKARRVIEVDREVPSRHFKQPPGSRTSHTDYIGLLG